MARAGIPNAGPPQPTAAPQQPPTPLPGQPVVPCWPGRKGSATLAFRRLWAVVSFCFRACISAASLDRGGEQGRVSLNPLPPVQAKTRHQPQIPRGLSRPPACLLPLCIPRETHLEALATASGSGAGMQKQAAGARLVSPPGPCTTQVCGSVLSISVYRSPRSSCT